MDGLKEGINKDSFPTIDDVNFDESFEALKDDKEALTELIDIQKTLISRYQSIIEKREKISSSSMSGDERAFVLYDIITETNEAMAEAKEAEKELLSRTVLKRLQLVDDLEAENKKLQTQFDGLMSKKKQLVSQMASLKKIYPNEPCPCGSGKKYKKCCGKN